MMGKSTANAAERARSTAGRAIALARSDLAVFAALAWPRFEMAQHHRLVIEKLEAVERGEIDRLMVFMPPRHGKSLITSQIFPAWFLGRNPERSVIAASYGAELALDFGRRVRNLVADPLQAAVFPSCKLSTDSTAAHRFNLINGGSYFAVGAGGPISGRGGHLLIIDDAVKNREEAFSATARSSLQAWFETTAYTRLAPSGAIIIVSTRWHADDLPGWLLREHADDGWTVLSLPALAEVDEGWRREGDALWSKRFPIAKLGQIRAAVGGAAWQALYQQRPAAAEGAIFKREWWRTYTPATVPARFEQVALSLDTAFKAGASNDYSVGLVLGVGETGYYVLDVWRDRVEFPELKRKVEMLAARWSPNVVLVEDKASGQSLIQELQTGSRLPIKAIKVDSDKVTRAAAITPLVEAGRVFLPENAPWLADFIDEVSSFPAAPHDDMVDALTQALNHVRDASPGGIFDFYRDQAERRARGEPEPEPDTSMIDEYNAERKRLNELEDKRRGVIHQTTVSSGSVPQHTGAPAMAHLAIRSLFGR